MPIAFQVLGAPGRDNALLVTVDSGQSIHRLLFDCGEGCLVDVPVAHVQEIEALCFSHFHMDHLAGFDSFLRLNWCRPETPVRIFGPCDSRDVIHHRLQGFTWNLAAGPPGEVQVSAIGTQIVTSKFLTREAFATGHFVEGRPNDGVAYQAKPFHIEALLLDHGTPSVAYIVRERPRQNIDTSRLSDLGLRPGPWLRAVKEGVDGETQMDGVTYSFEKLREELVVTQPGDSIAYLTDFRLDGPQGVDALAAKLDGCRTIVCENNYANADRELAWKNYHMVSADVGRLAARVDPERLVLFHLSDRYTMDEWRGQLAEVRARFPRTTFPDTWAIEGERPES